jgi:ubiquinone/menaquinone biosynthesis C-methylase UbiE
MAVNCHCCGGHPLIVFEGFNAFRRVTSDCRPWAAGGELALCSQCGTVQKPVTAALRDETEEIYRLYAMYHQSRTAAEQLSFASGTGTAMPRSNRLAKILGDYLDFSTRARFLDIGCGTGVTLRAMHEAAPSWSLEGYDPHLKNVDQLTALPGVAAIHTGRLADLPAKTYDCITCVHTLEHVINPQNLLKDARVLLADGGFLVIHVPYFQENFFELMIADHVSHFTPETIIPLLHAANLAPVTCTTTSIPREMAVLARSADSAGFKTQINQNIDEKSKIVASGLAWLNDALELAKEAASASKKFGVFGTSIAATWIAANLQAPLDFFVDEDTSRIGNDHMGRPIIAAGAVPAGSALFLALTPWVAADVAKRLSNISARLVAPPAWPIRRDAG